MNDLNFHIETIKRSIDQIAKLDPNKKEVSEAITNLMEHPNFQTLFNMKLQSKVIYERELCELIGSTRGSFDIADLVFQFNDPWVVNRQGDFLVSTNPNQQLGSLRYGMPVPVFVFRLIEENDDTNFGRDINTCVVGLMKPGEDLIYKVQFAMHRDMSSSALVNVLARLAPDFKVFATKL